MGNTASGPPGLNDQEQQAARDNFCTRVAASLGAKQLPEKERTMGCLFSVAERDNGSIPLHYAVVTHAFAWKYGTEMVVRFFADNDAAATEISTGIGPILSMILTMQETAKFRTHESCEIMFPIPFQDCSSGTYGAVVVEDVLLQGTHYKVDEFPEDGFLCDDSYWPQHFLDLVFLRPIDYAVTHAVALAGFVDILRMRSPHLINDFTLGPVSEDPTTAPALEALKLSSPARCGLDGMTMDLRVRKNGHEVDVVLGGRWMAPLLTALQEAFDKPSVPKGSLVSVEDENCTCVAHFECHDLEGELITPETAHIVVENAYFAPEGGRVVELDDDLKAAYVLLPAGELWKTKALVRRLCVRFYLPAALMANMIEHVRAAVRARAGDSDWDQRPLILEWVDNYMGKSGRSGFGEAFGSAASGGGENVTDRFRFICAGMNYFQDMVVIADNGEFQLILEEEDHCEDDDGDNEGNQGEDNINGDEA